MPALQGLGVLVTRPSQQAIGLGRLLESAGAAVFRLPTIEIRPADDLDALRIRLGAIKAFQFIIFTSANAVRFGSSLLDPEHDALLAAIGPATARALREAGFSAVTPIDHTPIGHTPIDHTPAGGFDSETLLQHPALIHCAGRRVLLVKGAHGRELLQEQLTLRGAQVSVAEVYRRERLRHDAAEIAALEARFAARDIHVITATSVEIAAGLLDLATPALRRGFEHAHWVVAGARVAGALRERGITAPILRANTALDQDLIAAIERWRASESGA